MIKFSITRLQKEPIELVGVEPAKFLELGDDEQFAVVSDVSYELAAQCVSGNALVSGFVRVTIEGSCGRCLEKVCREISTEKLQLLFPLEGIADELDISEDVRSEMLLALPMNLLCREDCAGLCPVCGINRNQKKCRCHEKPSGSLAWSALDDLKLE